MIINSVDSHQTSLRYAIYIPFSLFCAGESQGSNVTLCLLATNILNVAWEVCLDVHDFFIIKVRLFTISLMAVLVQIYPNAKSN